MKRLLVLLCAALCAASCASFEFERQDLCLRHDPKADTLELLIVSHGLRRTDARSQAVVSEAANGARRVLLIGWPLEFDLARIEEDLGEAADQGDPLATRARAWVAGIEVDEAGAWRNADGGVSMWQRVTLPRASEGMALLNELFNREAVRGESWNALDEGWDEASRDRMRRFAESGERWLDLEGGALVVRMPMSGVTAARKLRGWIGPSDEAAEASAIAAPLSELSLGEGLLTLLFRPDATGWVRFLLPSRDTEGSEPLNGLRGVTYEALPAEWRRVIEAPRPAQD